MAIRTQFSAALVIAIVKSFETPFTRTASVVILANAIGNSHGGWWEGKDVDSLVSEGSARQPEYPARSIAIEDMTMNQVQIQVLWNQTKQASYVYDRVRRGQAPAMEKAHFYNRWYTLQNQLKAELKARYCTQSQ